ncbi:MAG TPA: CPBP family intramembrane glutamic endopeptidase [Micromonosporaceae bacterium]|nr:CPBP family intramembrane glutamic endopeptidase [Micromonosporaceae bacterium]
MRSRSGIPEAVALLATTNVINNRVLPWLHARTASSRAASRGGPSVAYVGSCLLTASALVALARRRGLTWKELGLGGHSLRRGLIGAAGAAATVGAVYGAGLAMPPTRSLFADERAAPRLSGAAYQALVPVPFGTVLLEEVGFRGVLWGLVKRRYGAAAATAASSVLFGLWHVLPARELAKSNTTVASAVGSGARLTATSVAGTALGGLVLSELRRRSDSLLVPAGLHWALNGLGYVAAVLAKRGR